MIGQHHRCLEGIETYACLCVGRDHEPAEEDAPPVHVEARFDDGPLAGQRRRIKVAYQSAVVALGPSALTIDGHRYLRVGPTRPSLGEPERYIHFPAAPTQ
jgi:hypothetical protein